MLDKQTHGEMEQERKKREIEEENGKVKGSEIKVTACVGEGFREYAKRGQRRVSCAQSASL